MTRLYRKLVSKAKAGDQGAAKRLLKDLRDAARSPTRNEHGNPVYPVRREVMKYLAGCLTSLLNGTAADRAFNLVSRRGRPKSGAREGTQIGMAALYVSLLGGKSHAEAVTAVAAKFSKSDKTVEAAITRWTVEADGKRSLVFVPSPK